MGLEKFHTSQLAKDGTATWVMNYSNQAYGPYLTEDDARKAAYEILRLNDAHLKDRNFSADICKYWLKTRTEYSIVMEQEPQFKMFDNEDDLLKWANAR